VNRVLETIVFMQGDDADEAFTYLYPDRGDGSSGWPDGTDAVVEHLGQWDYGDPAEGFRYNDVNPYNMHETERYVVAWDYGHGWIALYRKPTAPEHWEEAADEFDARPLPLYF
jgi:hypothetical protein